MVKLGLIVEPKTTCPQNFSLHSSILLLLLTYLPAESFFILWLLDMHHLAWLYLEMLGTDRFFQNAIKLSGKIQ
jgi:hypothetical protein